MTDTIIQKLISRTLRYGVVLSAVFMAAGFLAYSFSSSAIPLPPDSTVPTLWAFFLAQPLGVVLTHPYFLLYTGILVLLCTPILRVIVAMVTFGLEKDWRFVWISSLVLFIIIVSITVASYE
jgi:uncharacterized membrane protein